jgi:hypothetical protein
MLADTQDPDMRGGTALAVALAPTAIPWQLLVRFYNRNRQPWLLTPGRGGQRPPLPLLSGDDRAIANGQLPSSET